MYCIPSQPCHLRVVSPLRAFILQYGELAFLVFAVSLDNALAQDPTASPSLAPSTSAAPTVVGLGECVDPAPDSGGGSNKVTIGNETNVCLQLGNGDNWAAGGVDYIHFTLQPKAGEYTRFYVPSSFLDLVARPRSDSPFGSKTITTGVASQEQFSFLRRYCDFELGRIYPHLTAIIEVEAGIVVGITWDDACVDCASDQCEENTVDFNGLEITQHSSASGQLFTKGCYITQEVCNTIVAQYWEYSRTGCDLTVNVVWTGTDSSGKTFQLAARNGDEVGYGSGATDGQSGGMTLVVVAMTVASMVGAGW